MFLDTSRYAKTQSDSVITTDGREVSALRLRRLPVPGGSPVVVHDGDQLDVAAQRRYGDSTRFWHIADANSELQANDLVARVLSTYLAPKS